MKGAWKKTQERQQIVSAFPTSALPESGSMGISQAQRHPCNTKNINNFAGTVNAHQQAASIPAYPAWPGAQSMRKMISLSSCLSAER